MGCAKRGANGRPPLANLVNTNASGEANASGENVKPRVAAAGATKQAAFLRVAAKCGACFVVLLGIVAQATTFVARLAFIRILLATQSAWHLFRGSLANSGREGAPQTAPRDRRSRIGTCAV